MASIRPHGALRPDRLTRREVTALYPADRRVHYEPGMVGWAVAFYACYAAFVLELLPFWAFALLGVSAFVRNQNRWHEALHADQRGSSWLVAQVLLALPSPVYLGRRELEEMHLLHHREHDGVGDPDHRMMDPSALRAALWCFVQPELSAAWWIRRRGLGARLATTMAVHALVWALLMWFGGWRGFVAYNVVARIGNTAAWFVFAWLVHQPWLYGQVDPPEFPRPVRWLWYVLVGRENYWGVRFHFMHHLYSAVPDRRLPALARRLAGPAGGSAPEGA